MSDAGQQRTGNMHFKGKKHPEEITSESKASRKSRPEASDALNLVNFVYTVNGPLELPFRCGILKL